MIVVSLTLKFNVNKFKIFDKSLFSFYFKMLPFAVCQNGGKQHKFYYFCVLTSFFEINKIRLGYACINN